MRIPAVIVFLLAAMSAANAQCALGAFPTTNGDGTVVCQSAGGQRPPSAGYDPGGGAIGSCPQGATASVDSWGNRSCSTLAQQGSGGLEEGPAVKKPKKKQFEISKKCPLCK
jgi:hypothetical protein